MFARLLFSTVLLFASQFSVYAVDYFEVELSDLEAAQLEYPNWLAEVSEEGGEFLPDVGWSVNDRKPFGMGKLFLTLERKHLDSDIALTFTSPNASNVAVQLYDESDRVIAVDLLAERVRGGAERDVITVVVPLAKYPTAKHIVLRRLDGVVEMPYLALLPLSYPVPQETSQLQELANRLGDPTAIENSYMKRIQSEVGGDVDILKQTPESIRPLYELARQQGSDRLSESDLLAVLQVLGLQGFDFNAFDFVRAAGEGREEVVGLYLRAGMPIDVQGENRYTAVAEAATSGELRVIKLLCDNGADLEIRTAGGNTALWMACYGSNFEATRILVEAGADVNARCVRGDTPLNILIQWRHRNKIQTLATVKFLMENGVDTEVRDDRGRTVLHVAIEEGWTDEVREVLRYSPDLEARNHLGHTPMMVVEYRNSASMKRELLKAGAKPWTPSFDSLDDELVFRVHRREYGSAISLVEAGANPNVKDLEGDPIAFRVVRHRNISRLQSFMKLGLRLDARNHKNESLLDAGGSSFDESMEQMIAFLLEQGLDPNYATAEELHNKAPYWTPLMSAANSGNLFRCRQFLAAGANPTVKNRPGRTAAMIAERSGQIQLAAELRTAEAEWLAQAEAQ